MSEQGKRIPDYAGAGYDLVVAAETEKIKWLDANKIIVWKLKGTWMYTEFFLFKTDSLYSINHASCFLCMCTHYVASTVLRVLFAIRMQPY